MTTTRTRRTEIKLESTEIRRLTLRTTRRPEVCERCGVMVDAFTPSQIAEFLNVSVGEVYSLLESGEIHIAGRGEPSLICANPNPNKRQNKEQLQ
ncbi:MAG TPA: helix-turn-helix domain-containing protein [Pyrinomonadaceae bacterium]|nr:helix-turn-helix domain-containing protein [Pyrinomonadaceae bacterium]